MAIIRTTIMKFRIKKPNSLLITVIITICVFISCNTDSTAVAQDNHNTKEEIDLGKGLYPNLPNSLITRSGLKVEDIATWENIRRKEIMQIFTDSIYGRSPKQNEYTANINLLSTTPIFEATAVRKMVEFTITGPKGIHTYKAPLYLPNSENKVPVIILINHRSSITGTTPNSGFFPFQSVLLPRGYGAAVINVDEVAMDDRTDWDKGIIDAFDMFGLYDWKCLSAWTFAVSRMIDYLETDDAVDITKIGVIGHSRGGKASMWAGAQDQRIALTCANDAGLGGDKLVRRAQGALLERIGRVFPRWYSTKATEYANQDQTLPFDWHQLTSTIAPRLLATGAASKDGNADPVGQFHTLVFTQPVFALYGKADIKWTVDDAPNRSSTQSILLENGNIHHHLRIGEHDLKIEDWNYYLDFADRNL